MERAQRYDRQLLLADAKRNAVLELQEVERYGIDSYGDAEYVSIYGLRPFETPSLGGQPSFFVVAQLFLFREGRCDNAAMVASCRGLTNSDLTAFADRVAKLPPRPPGRRRPTPPASHAAAGSP